MEPTAEFWFLAGLALAFVGYGVMKLMVAHAERNRNDES